MRTSVLSIACRARRWVVPQMPMLVGAGGLGSLGVLRGRLLVVTRGRVDGINPVKEGRL